MELDLRAQTEQSIRVGTAETSGRAYCQLLFPEGRYKWIFDSYTHAVEYTSSCIYTICV